jgi:hypothetical protein
MELSIQNIYYIVGTVFMVLAIFFIVFLIIVTYKIQKVFKNLPVKALNSVVNILRGNKFKFGGVLGAIISGFLVKQINSIFRKRAR